MSKELFMQQHLREGELYAGLLLGQDGAPDQHIFLLRGVAEKVTWNEAMAWAEKAGGSLPNRREQSLLFSNLKAEFTPAWHWSCEQHADNSDYAWNQVFDDGNQGNGQKSFAGRARAVRRLAI